MFQELETITTGVLIKLLQSTKAVNYGNFKFETFAQAKILPGGEDRRGKQEAEKKNNPKTVLKSMKIGRN